MPSMSQEQETSKNRKRYWLNLTLAGAAGQVGCVTLLIILLAVLGGMWLDARFQTRPLFTLGLVLASIPVSLAAMLFIVRLVTSKIKPIPPGEEESNEEVGIGNDS
jgi:ABC-type methionine transport system permease subunit